MRTPKLTANRRLILEAVAAGHVEAEYAASVDEQGERFDGTTYFGDFYRTDIDRARRVSTHVTALIAAGLAETDHANAKPITGPFMSFAMNAAPVVITDAGRAVLELPAAAAKAKPTALAPQARELLAAVGAGVVTGMFSSQYDSPRWAMVPAIEGTRVGKFERTDRTSCHLVTDQVVSLIAGGYAAAERIGDFYTHISAQHAEYVAAGIDDTSKRCDVAVVLTAAGRAALGLPTVAEPVPAEKSPEVAPAAKPRRPRKPRKPCASALAVAARLSCNPDQAAGVHAEETGFRKSTVTTTLRRMIAAGEVIAVEDFDGSPLYHLAEAARERYAPARRLLALAA